MLASMIDTHPEVILKLFKSILNSCEIIPGWLIGFIVPIYNKGERSLTHPPTFRSAETDIKYPIGIRKGTPLHIWCKIGY